MCGINGIIGIDNVDKNKSIIQVMNNTLKHRGPDASSVYANINVGLGHQRLSIIDLSDAANQPFTDNSGRYVMVFNGEIYNYLEIKKQLQNYSFSTNSDTEVLLAAYIQMGEGFLHLLRGMFAIAIWDNKENSLFIARDRLGIKPFYYYNNDSQLIFSSELRALLSTNAIPRKIDKVALCDYLSYQTVHAPNTLIEGVKQLMPGEFAIYKNRQFIIKKYWQISKAHRIEESEQKIKNNVKDLFFQAIERRMISDVPLGAFLSGGIDSSAVVAAMANVSNQKINTFSIGFKEKEFDESHYAKIIAKKYNTNHTQLELSANNFLEQLPEIIPQFDSPSGDGANTFIVSQMVKQAGITVALSGLGGDELFAGYDIFKNYKKISKYAPMWKMPKGIKKGVLSTAAMFLDSAKSEKISLLAEPNEFSIDKIYPLSRRLLSQNTINNITQNVPYIDALQQQLFSIKNDLKQMPMLSQISIAEITGYTQNVLLKDTDQMSMAHALEVRVPFFDTDLVEYTLSIKDKWKYPKYPKSLLVESLNPLLPDEIVHRKKMGFSFPWSYWMKNQLKTFCEAHIQHLKNYDFFDSKGLQNLWNEFLKDVPTIKWSHIWTLVVLSAWLKENKF